MLSRPGRGGRGALRTVCVAQTWMQRVRCADLDVDGVLQTVGGVYCADLKEADGVCVADLVKGAEA